MEIDSDLCELIDRCEKPLSALKYAKLLYDFGNCCRPEDWEYISSFFMNNLKSNDDLKSFTRNLKKCTLRFVILIDFKFFFHFD